MGHRDFLAVWLVDVYGHICKRTREKSKRIISHIRLFLLHACYRQLCIVFFYFILHFSSFLHLLKINIYHYRRNCADVRNWPRWSITDTAGTLKETGTRPDFSNRIIERMGYGDQWSADRSIIHQAQYTYTRLITSKNVAHEVRINSWGSNLLITCYARETLSL